MNVSRVYTRDVIAIPRSTSLKEAARLMCAHHVGSLVVAVEIADLARIIRQERSRESSTTLAELADPVS